MGKVFTSERQSKNERQKRRWRNGKNKYLKPGALAQIRNSKASSASKAPPCTDLGKKRVAVLHASHTGDGDSNRSKGTTDTAAAPPILVSPGKFQFSPVNGLAAAESIHQSTPKTPRAEDGYSESRLESLPIDILVKILCHLHHDQLRAVFHVSQKVRRAVIIARQFHFNYTTPDRSRQEMLNTMTPIPTDHWPFTSKANGKGILIPTTPHTPKAPKHGPRLPSRLKFTEMRQIAAVLFQDTSFSLVPSVLQKPMCKSLGSNRVLFYEDELCQAVAQNKLR
ncbi:F-box protein At4g35930 [Andrographis paniculata]|uniref:F-box protein At4g35930 n=1 Tax=Andrographis paniculata TaxID=175694 RepID=UPI0021E83707|nr:F-box protein At4g35930 [Andrographis paniculata]XP_051140926.1 F-box protein At4g35930 [Andrographis paniculata]XP_051140927.1 F-box protein At4g35930 [Andrographis paniculata]XP_051140928.1 F-box protein At4g35930 [Andrographis paniculata]XP_051140929.1 F-box protein At4g35930 [Andrographis paniculata]XP_051140930.1 F-box protein At4g35930 [Andrographis paniculata]